MSGTVTSIVPPPERAGAGAGGAGFGGAGAATVAAAGAAAFGASGFGAGAGAAAAPSASSAMITSPCDTLSPTLTLIPRTVPDAGAGTSMVAFSDSSVISAESFSTRWPSLTSTSMTGTFL